MQSACDDVSKQRATLKRRLQRAKELYEWGHKSKEEYWADYNMIQQQLQSLAPAKDQARGLERLALFLKDISEAWKQADEQQRNRLAKQLFDIVWIKDKKVLAVTPRPEFKPFFDLQYEGLSQGVMHLRPRGASGHHAISGQRTISGTTTASLACSLEREVVASSVARG